jgi:hypothetical protein
MGQLPVYIRKLSNEMELSAAYALRQVIGVAESDPYASLLTLDPQYKNLWALSKRELDPNAKEERADRYRDIPSRARRIECLPEQRRSPCEMHGRGQVGGLPPRRHLRDHPFLARAVLTLTSFTSCPMKTSPKTTLRVRARLADSAYRLKEGRRHLSIRAQHGSRCAAGAEREVE